MTECGFRRRSGYTLMEIVTVLPAITVLLVVATGWIHYTLRFANEIKQQRNHHRSLTRMIWDIRDDVSQGKELSVEGDSLTVAFGDGHVSTFKVSGAAIEFSEHNDGQLIRQDVYRLYPFSRTVWELDPSRQEVKLIVFRGDRKLGKDKILASRLNVIELETSFRVARWTRKEVHNGQ